MAASSSAPKRNGKMQIDLIGGIAAILTTSAFIPQAWLTWRTRRAEGVSIGMYSIFITGVLFWLVYGCLLGSWPIIAANIVTLLLALFILAMKFLYK
jgi:MtN3 and saliva related transmembrane protein